MDEDADYTESQCMEKKNNNPNLALPETASNTLDISASP